MGTLVGSPRANKLEDFSANANFFEQLDDVPEDNSENSRSDRSDSNGYDAEDGRRSSNQSEERPSSDELGDSDFDDMEFDEE
jgi:hypothetical protein